MHGGRSNVGLHASRKSNTTSLSQGSLHAASACSNTHPRLLAHAQLQLERLAYLMTLHDDHSARPKQYRRQC